MGLSLILVERSRIIFFGLGSALAPSLGWLLLLRAMVGFGIGGMVVPYDLLAEFLPSKIRGSVLLAFQLFWSLGGMIVAWVAYATLDHKFAVGESWRWLVVFCNAPLVFVLIFLRWIPESPRWLSAMGRHAESEELLQWIVSVNGCQLPPNFKLREPDIAESLSLKALFSEDLRVVTVFLWVLWIGFGFSYYGYK